MLKRKCRQNSQKSVQGGSESSRPSASRQSPLQTSTFQSVSHQDPLVQSATRKCLADMLKTNNSQNSVQGGTKSSCPSASCPPPFQISSYQSISCQDPLVESATGKRLADDLVTEILLRQPVKSLLRFECVCKNWRSIINSSSFIKEHFDHKSNPTRLVLQRELSSDSGKPITSIVLTETGTHVTEKLSYLLQVPVRVDEIIGPVHGIFLMSRDNGRALWNPVRREFRPLPPYHREFISGPPSFVGFGFDPLSHDYKVVCIWRCGTSKQEVYAAVYSLGNNSWSNLTPPRDNGRYTRGPSLCSTCLNGVYYWCIMFESDLQILSFDMHNEVFGEIPGPRDPKYTCITPCLTLYKESVCLIVSHLTKKNVHCFSKIDTWLMKDDKSWTKVTSVKLSIQGVCLNPLWFLGHDKFILLCFGRHRFCPIYKTGLYDAKTHEFIELLGESCYTSRVLSYRESLVSIKSKDDEYHKQGDVMHLIQDYFSKCY